LFLENQSPRQAVKQAIKMFYAENQRLIDLMNPSTYLKPRLLLALTFSLCVFLLAGCANKNKDDDDSERELYEAAQKALKGNQFDTAIDYYRKIELRYPFGRYAEQAQLETIYAYYKNLEPAAANVSASRFIRQYPEHPNLDYAYYLRGLSNYHVDSSFADRFVMRGSVKRDLSSAKEAFEDFDELIERFPNSEYVADAQKRMLYIRDLIAHQEVEVANYYMQRTAYVAAVNRAKAVIEDYPGSQASADALALLVHAYHEMGINDLASDSLKVLQHSFPDYDKLMPDGSLAPYEKLYEDEVNWLNFISFGYLNKKDSIKSTKINEPGESDPQEIPAPKALSNEAKEETTP
jgi:outer membrane protein assembly factor BamD